MNGFQQVAPSPSESRPMRLERRGWFAVPKAARDRIREKFDGQETCATALAVFDALCEIANDKGACEFVVDQPWLAGRSGCSLRTLRSRLHELRDYGVIAMIVPPLRGPATFRIIGIESLPPFGNGSLTLGDNCRTFGKDACRASLPTTEEDPKNGHEQQLKLEATAVSPRAKRAAAPPPDDEWIASLKTNPAFRALDVDDQLLRCRAWCDANGKTCTRRRFTNWLLRADRPLASQHVGIGGSKPSGNWPDRTDPRGWE